MSRTDRCVPRPARRIPILATALLAAGLTLPAPADAQVAFDLSYPRAVAERLGDAGRNGTALGAAELAGILAEQGDVRLMGDGPVRARIAVFVTDHAWNVEARLLSDPFDVNSGRVAVSDHLDAPSVSGFLEEQLASDLVVEDHYFPDTVILESPSATMESLAGTAVAILPVEEGTRSVVVVVLPAEPGTAPVVLTGAAVVAVAGP